MPKHKMLCTVIIMALLAVALPQFLVTTPVMAAIEEFGEDAINDDTYLREDEDYDHDGASLRMGVVGSDGTCRTVLEYFINWGVDIPDGATIVEATLTLDVSSSSGDDMTLRCQRLKQPFAESSADWSHYSGSLQWDGDGASGTDDYTTTDQATESYSSGQSWLVWDVTDIVEYCQQQDDNEVMFRIVAATETAYEYVNAQAKEGSGEAPTLSIQYSCGESPSDSPPTVTTGSVSAITDTTATLAGTTTYVDNGLAIYDDFEWGNDGDPLSDSGGAVTWSIQAAGSSKAEIDTAYDYGAGTRSGLLYHDGSNNPRADFSYTAMGSSETLSIRVRKDTDSRWAFYHGNGAKAINVYIDNLERIHYYDGSHNYPGETVTVGSWNLIEITDVNWAAGTYSIYLNGWCICEADMRTTTSWGNIMRFVNQAGTVASCWMDNIGFHGYVATRGFQYGLTQTPTWTESEDGLFDTGAFSLGIDSLSPDTQYWYRAFVTNEEGTAYGSWADFTTLGPPSITTVAASSVASTTARLNSALTDDGNDPCTIKFGWGLTSQSVVDDYDSTETLAGTYETGQNPYLDISGLVTGQQYYFRVQATNDAGTVQGSQLTFNTTVDLFPPSDFIGYPAATSISLTWAKGVGATNTLVRYGTSSFPTTTTNGTLAYYGDSSTYTLTGLASGQTHYFSAWGESGGNYSASYTTLIMTTSATSDADDDNLDVPGQPTRWFSAPDYTSMDGLLVVYDAFNAAADSGQIPRATAWFLAALGLSFLAGLITYLALGKKMMIAMIVLTVCLAFGYFVRLIPWWIPLLSLIMAITFKQTHKQVEVG